MSLPELQDWLVSDPTLANEIQALRAWTAMKSVGSETLNSGTTPSSESVEHDWKRLILAASILAESSNAMHQETALMIGQAAMVFADQPDVRDAGAVILTQLSNFRAIRLATSREIIQPNVEGRLGISEQMLATRRRLETSIRLSPTQAIEATEFQSDLWTAISNNDWTSATAPTAAGKTFLILNWLIAEVRDGRCKLGVFIAPTRALVGELEKELLELRGLHKIEDLRVASVPLVELGDQSKPTLLVFTQERLHIFLNSFETPPPIDVAVADEVQKLGDGLRGVILQDALERTGRTNPKCRFVFLSPHVQNPSLLLEDAPAGLVTSVVKGGPPTVTQNLLIAAQRRYKPRQWTLDLVVADGTKHVGGFTLHDRPIGERKRLAFVALALGRRDSGTLVYANGAAESEHIAHLLFEALDGDEGFTDGEDDAELADLARFCREMIHPLYLLGRLVRRRIAFHYGNMPTLLRTEIERLFKEGKIRFLVCTSTLIEGVNLACRTIIVRGPRKGVGTPMGPQDFWNLAGRAGRWGADFHGNIVCVDVAETNLWPDGIPAKASYPIERETDAALRNPQEVTSYIRDRPHTTAAWIDPQLEHVAAYLLSWHQRTGTIASSPPARRLAPEAVSRLNDAAVAALSDIEIPSQLASAHPGISVVALQSLLALFKEHDGEIDHLLPPPPESYDSVDGFVEVFRRINAALYPAFVPDQATLPMAFTTIDWMRGKPLAQMIKERIDRARKKRKVDSVDDLPVATIIRDTMKDVEEIARFRAPKYLSAYLDVLKFHFQLRGISDKFPQDLKYELFLEYGVSSQTLLSLVRLGMSRTSAIVMGDFLGQSDLDERSALSRLAAGGWEALDIPLMVKREIRSVVAAQLGTQGSQAGQ